MRSGSDPDIDPKYYHYVVPFLRPQGVWQLFDCCPPVRETKKFIKYLQARNLNWRFRPYSFGLEYQGQLSPSRQAPFPPPPRLLSLSRQLYGALYEVTSCDSFLSTILSADLNTQAPNTVSATSSRVGEPKCLHEKKVSYLTGLSYLPRQDNLF